MPPLPQLEVPDVPRPRVHRLHRVNCWADRLRVINAFADADPAASGTLPALGYRIGGRPLGWKRSPVPVVSLDSVLGVTAATGSRDPASAISRRAFEAAVGTLGGAADRADGRGAGKSNAGTEGPMEYELIKLDADGPEGAWLKRIEELLSARRLRARTLVIECNNCEARTLYLLQHKHGYDNAPLCSL